MGDLKELGHTIDNVTRDAVIAERKRCVSILQLAREGEIDNDLRSLINRIENPQAGKY